jgi:hypothetical protein
LYEKESCALENPSLKDLESLHTGLIIILYENLRSFNLAPQVRKLRRKSLEHHSFVCPWRMNALYTRENFSISLLREVKEEAKSML